MSKDYPTDEELDKVTNYDFKEGYEGLVEFVRSIWWLPDWGFVLKGKHVKRLELHTGGWSGNEDIMSALKGNWMFWSCTWQKTLRGGHFYFKIPKAMWVKDEAQKEK